MLRVRPRAPRASQCCPVRRRALRERGAGGRGPGGCAQRAAGREGGSAALVSDHALGQRPRHGSTFHGGNAIGKKFTDMSQEVQARVLSLCCVFLQTSPPRQAGQRHIFLTGHFWNPIKERISRSPLPYISRLGGGGEYSPGYHARHPGASSCIMEITGKHLLMGHRNYRKSVVVVC